MKIADEMRTVLGCLAHDIYNITCANEYGKMDKIVDQALSEIINLILRKVEKMYKDEDEMTYGGCNPDWNKGHNDCLTQLKNMLS